LSLHAALAYQSTWFQQQLSCRIILTSVAQLSSAGPVPYCCVLLLCCWQQHPIIYRPSHHQSIQLHSKN